MQPWKRCRGRQGQVLLDTNRALTAVKRDAPRPVPAAALKLSYGKTKVVLRRLANGLLPGDLANLANRRKHGLRLWSMLTFA